MMKDGDFIVYAIVRNIDGSFYTSPVFAHYYKIWDTSENDYQKYLDSIYDRFYIVLNQQKTKLIRQYVFYRSMESLEPQIHIVDTQKDNWISVNNDFACIDFLRSVDFSSEDVSVPSNILEECLRLDQKEIYREYVDIETEQDIENFIFVSSGMHDAFIETIKQDNDALYVLFDGCWGLKIEMWFMGDFAYSTDARNHEDGDPYWYGATFKKENEYYYLIDEEDMSVDEITDDFCWFKAKSVRYHLILQ